MTNKSILVGRKVNNCGENLEPMLCYCSKIITELNSEDTYRLTEELLTVLKDFRPVLKVDKKSCSFSLDSWTAKGCDS
jgi:hypothetical protein